MNIKTSSGLAALSLAAMTSGYTLAQSSTYLLNTNNLSDVSNSATALSNLNGARTDLSNVSASSSNGTTTPYQGTLLNPGDGVSHTNRLLSVTGPSGNRNYVNAAETVNMIDPGSGMQSGQGSSGAALVLNASKPSYYNSTNPGEIDVLQIGGRQGYGDMDGITENLVGVYGGMAAFEGQVQLVQAGNPSNVLNQIGVQLGIMNNYAAPKGPGQTGVGVLSIVGTTAQGFEASAFKGASITYPFQYNYADSAGGVHFPWQVNQDGTESGPHGLTTMGANSWTPSFSTTSGTIGSVTINKAWAEQDGNIERFGVDATITSPGSTPSGTVIMTLPLNSSVSRTAGTLTGLEPVNTGKGLTGQVSQTYATLRFVDNTGAPYSNGSNIIITGTYSLN